MTLGLGRFEYYLIQLDELFLAACKTTNPALYLYKNDARTKVFMLEGLAKLYAGIYNEKRFAKLKARLKALEDALGSIDYYDSFAKDFLKDKGIPKPLRIAIAHKRDEKITLLNTLLLRKKWINHYPLRTKKIRKALKKITWKDSKKEIALIEIFYKNAIADINLFYENTGAAFINIEAQVHELRRKLRWLSIYPQALRGAIQFSTKKVADKLVKKYLIPEIVNSPFNIFPIANNNEDVMMVEKNHFLALSNVIAALGKLKDKGLRILVLLEAEQETKDITEADALKTALTLNKLTKNGLQNILKNAKEICEPFFEEKNLEKMLVV